MKAVILAGGLGTRISEETTVKPKPMVEVGGKPILWHILKIFSAHGINEFVICCGYKGYVIKEYFANYFLHMSDVTFHMQKNMEVHHKKAEPWEVTLVDTGETSMTGGRLKRVRDYVRDETFCFHMVMELLILTLRRSFHITKPTDDWELLLLFSLQVVMSTTIWRSLFRLRFQEKPQGDGGWINGGFVLEPQVIDRIEGDDTIWEQAPLRSLASDGELTAYHQQVSGSLWILCAIECIWRILGPSKAPWKVW